jgi:hypothetical protein
MVTGQGQLNTTGSAVARTEPNPSSRKDKSACQPGQYIGIGDGKNELISCRACDGEQGDEGGDVFVGGPDGPDNYGKCEKKLKEMTGGKGTGWYCVKCSNEKPTKKGKG